jgi:hypothetical protein
MTSIAGLPGVTMSRDHEITPKGDRIATSRPQSEER